MRSPESPCTGICSGFHCREKLKGQARANGKKCKQTLGWDLLTEEWGNKRRPTLKTLCLAKTPSG